MSGSSTSVTTWMVFEVMAVELEGGDLYVIHAMPMRKKYAEQYEEAKRWRE